MVVHLQNMVHRPADHGRIHLQNVVVYTPAEHGSYTCGSPGDHCRIHGRINTPADHARIHAPTYHGRIYAPADYGRVCTRRSWSYTPAEYGRIYSTLHLLPLIQYLPALNGTVKSVLKASKSTHFYRDTTVGFSQTYV
jgi:hypothetical protein